MLSALIGGQMRILIFAFCLFTAISAQAQIEATENHPQQGSMQEYFAANRNNYDKSLIYVFFNNEPCYSCATAIAIIEQIYNRNFLNEYNLFLINYQNDYENNFINTYSLSKPLEVVLVRIDDGAAFGYRKLENLQNMTSDPVSLQDYFVSQVRDYLGNNG